MIKCFFFQTTGSDFAWVMLAKQKTLNIWVTIYLPKNKDNFKFDFVGMVLEWLAKYEIDYHM